MQTWERFELVENLKLTFKGLINIDDPTYIYCKDRFTVYLRHSGKQYWFGVEDDEGEFLPGPVFDDYTNKEEFLAHFSSFCDFFNAFND